ncbi:MAG: hypothetical protein ED859_04180 [Desulfuromonadales bacterium]|nr:MAG: hypothetical protein ED859_04180 [Desulfuromonadales bacterium]
MAASAAALLLVPATGVAADLGISSDTIVRVLERDDKNGSMHSLLPVYEFLRLDYSAPRMPGLSLHVHGWGRLNLRDNYNSNTTAGELLYAYLDYLEPGSRDWQLRLGRQYIFEGVTRESIDGLYAKTDIVPTVTASAYAGFPVNLDETNGRTGDSIFGFRLAQGLPGYYDAAVSYKKVSNDSARDEEILGTDATLLLPGNITLLGHSSYNLVTSGWGEHSYEARIPIASLEFRPFYQKFTYGDFFSSKPGSAHPFRFLSGYNDKITVVGSEGFWYPAENVEVGARYKHYEYDRRYGSADMYTALATLRRKIFSEVGIEFGRVEGDIAENRYYLGRAYAYWDAAPYFVTGDVMYVSYDDPIYREDRSFFASLGVGGRFMEKALTLKLSLDYSEDPYFAKDYRGTFAASYTYGK